MSDLASPSAAAARFRPSFSLPLAIEETEVLTEDIITHADIDEPHEIADGGAETLKTDLFEIGASGFTRTAQFEAARQEKTKTGDFLTTGGGLDSNSPHQLLASLTHGSLLHLGILGRGASGVVAKVLHKPSLLVLALKIIDVADKSKRNQVLKELKQLDSTSSNPYLVQFYGAFYESGQVKLALEYLNRGSLQAVLQDYGPLKEVLLQAISKQMLLGLAHLHASHAIHRDIKPGNILLNWRGETKLSDFGILAELQSTMAEANTFVGTMIYMSPERLMSTGYTYNCDLWSIGMSLLTLACGKFPLDTRNGYWGIISQLTESEPPKLPKTFFIERLKQTVEFSDDFRDFVSQCLVKDPKERPGADSLLSHPWILAARPMEELYKFWPKGMKMWRPTGKQKIAANNLGSALSPPGSRFPSLNPQRSPSLGVAGSPRSPGPVISSPRSSVRTVSLLIPQFQEFDVETVDEVALVSQPVAPSTTLTIEELMELKQRRQLKASSILPSFKGLDVRSARSHVDLVALGGLSKNFDVSNVPGRPQAMAKRRERKLVKNPPPNKPATLIGVDSGLIDAELAATRLQRSLPRLNLSRLLVPEKSRKSKAKPIPSARKPVLSIIGNSPGQLKAPPEKPPAFESPPVPLLFDDFSSINSDADRLQKAAHFQLAVSHKLAAAQEAKSFVVDKDGKHPDSDRESEESENEEEKQQEKEKEKEKEKVEEKPILSRRHSSTAGSGSASPAVEYNRSRRPSVVSSGLPLSLNGSIVPSSTGSPAVPSPTNRGVSSSSELAGLLRVSSSINVGPRVPLRISDRSKEKPAEQENSPARPPAVPTAVESDIEDLRTILEFIAEKEMNHEQLFSTPQHSPSPISPKARKSPSARLIASFNPRLVNGAKSPRSFPTIALSPSSSSQARFDRGMSRVSDQAGIPLKTVMAEYEKILHATMKKEAEKRAEQRES